MDYRHMAKMAECEAKSMGALIECEALSMGALIECEALSMGALIECEAKSMGALIECEAKSMGALIECEALSMGSLIECEALSMGSLIECEALSMGSLIDQAVKAAEDSTRFSMLERSIPDRARRIPTSTGQNRDQQTIKTLKSKVANLIRENEILIEENALLDEPLRLKCDDDDWV